MPNRLWYCAASPLWPHADSSMACAMVTAAGTPNRCCAAIAPGATRLMNDCCSLVPGVTYCRPAVLGGAACAGRALGVAAGWVAAGPEGAGADGVTVGVAAGV